MKKTYGVHGLMEWSAIVGNGNVSVRVEFTGGSVTGYGVSPAEYTTDNPVVQTLIEESSYFKNGRISLLSGYAGVAATAEPKKSDTLKPRDNQPKKVSVNEARDILKKRGCKGEELLGEGLFRLAAINGLEIDKKG